MGPTRTVGPHINPRTNMNDEHDRTPEGFTPEEWKNIPPAQRLRLYLNGEMADDPPEGFCGEDPRETTPYSGMIVDARALPPDLQRMLLDANPALAGSPWSPGWSATDPDCPRHFRAPGDGGLTIGQIDDFCRGAARWFELPPGLEVVLTWSATEGFMVELI